jgi:uncharacterized membrane protein
MASSKARSSKRPASSGQGGRSATVKAQQKSSRTVAAVAATPTNSGRPAKQVAPRVVNEEQAAAVPEVAEAPVAEPGPPLWLQLTTFVLAILGLAISAYETYAHYNGSTLLGCSAKAGGTFDCTAVITSPQSMVFGVIPVAILGLAFYVVAVPLFSPWGWQLRYREVQIARLASIIVGMGFVMYLIYAELYQIGQVCEYCSGVHIVTFVLFCITVFSAAIWGLGTKRLFGARS